MYLANPCNPREKAYINALIDSGASKSSISQRLAKSIKLKYETTEFEIRRFADQNPVKLQGGYADLNLQSYRKDLKACIRVQVLPDPIPNLFMPDWRKLKNNWTHLRNIEFPHLAPNNRIDMVIGNDLLNLVTTHLEVKIPLQNIPSMENLGVPVARRYPLGWAAQGMTHPDANLRNRIANSSGQEQFMAVYDSATSEDIDRLPDQPTEEDKDRKIRQLQDAVDQFLREQWEMEQIDIHKEVPLQKDEQRVIDDWEKKVQFNNGRYSLPMPWRPNMKRTNNRALAVVRHRGLMKKFKRDGPQARAQFDSVIQDYITNGYVTRVEDFTHDPPGAYYLPPFYVPGKSTTPIRPVFDAAAKHLGKCFNDYVFPGPCYVPDIRVTYLRFRRNKYALTGDVKAMFLQIEVAEKDRPALRFLWNDPADNKDYVMQFTRWAFGINAAPAAASWTLRHHAELFREKYPLAAEAVFDNTLVDDCLKSVKTKEELIKLYFELIAFFKAMGMKIHKFGTNLKELLDQMEPDKIAADIDLNGELREHRLGRIAPTIKTLGIGWRSSTDSMIFTYEAPVVTKWTSRTMLSIYMGLYDPNGQLLPFVTKAKRAFQLTRQAFPNWDDPITGPILDSWTEWIKSCEDLAKLTIPRAISDREGPQKIVIFSDASLLAYGAVAYMVTGPSETPSSERETNEGGDETRGVCVRQLLAMGKINPTKQETVPRLELEAARMSTKVAKIVLKAYPTFSRDDIVYFSDSQTVLKWLNMGTRLQDTYTGHRVSDITKFSEPEQWRYVPTDENPADILSRGSLVRDLIPNKLWWEGPEWLKLPKENWPDVPTLQMDDRVKTGMKKNAEQYAYAMDAELCTPILPDSMKSMINRSSNWEKSCRITVRVKRIAKQDQPVAAGISPVEILKAEKQLIKCAQAEAFPELWNALYKNRVAPKRLRKGFDNPEMDTSNVIRITGRLKGCRDLKYDEACPILLPADSVVTKKIVEHYHYNVQHHGAGLRTLMATIRQRFHIKGGKKVVQQIIKDCTHCKRVLAQQRTLPPSRLPDARVGIEGEAPSAQVFRDVGIDFAGPYYVSRGRGKPKEKRWILLFVCMKVRAIHLEMTRGESAEAVINALERFTARKGTPAAIYCDNGTGFVKTDKDLREAYHEAAPELRQYFARIDFVFNPARAPTFGGHYERFVRAVKRSLTSLMLSTGMNDDTLQTALCKAENMLNARPLAFRQAHNQDDPLPLTPDHFLVARMYKHLPEIKDVSYAKLWRQAQTALALFWHRFKREYIPVLNKPPPKNQRHAYNLEVGDVVCDVSDKNAQTLMGNWPLGVVIHVTTSADGVTRQAIIRKPSKRFGHRAAKDLIKLEALDRETLKVYLKEKCKLQNGVKLTKEQMDQIRAESIEEERICKARRKEELEREIKILLESAKSNPNQSNILSEGVQTRSATKAAKEALAHQTADERTVTDKNRIDSLENELNTLFLEEQDN